jgi:6-pyruvoyltetrahydropterin/6-carboxytetrahydropterin synthase
MADFRFRFQRRYSMAHRLISGRSAKCAVPHGHNEIVVVTLVADAEGHLDGASNMVESFERAKSTWHRWIDEHVDHAFQVSRLDPIIGFFRRAEPEKLARLLVTPGDPTTEALAACFMGKVNAILGAAGGRLRCLEVAIEETPTNVVVFGGDPAAHLADAGPRAPWWLRADMSINDLEPAETARPVAALAAR